MSSTKEHYAKLVRALEQENARLTDMVAALGQKLVHTAARENALRLEVDRLRAEARKPYMPMPLDSLAVRLTKLESQVAALVETSW